jgi:hypothetical protein
MIAKPGIDSAELLREHLAQASPDLLRELMQGLQRHPALGRWDSVCGASYGARDDARTNRRGCRHREARRRGMACRRPADQVTAGELNPVCRW